MENTQNVCLWLTLRFTLLFVENQGKPPFLLGLNMLNLYLWFTLLFVVLPNKQVVLRGNPRNATRGFWGSVISHHSPSPSHRLQELQRVAEDRQLGPARQRPPRDQPAAIGSARDRLEEGQGQGQNQQGAGKAGHGEKRKAYPIDLFIFLCCLHGVDSESCGWFWCWMRNLRLILRKH